MSRLWSASAKRLEPYTPGLQPTTLNTIKLNTNESPYGPSPLALEAMRATADDGLRLYPDPNSHNLCSTIAALYGLKPEQVYAGNGSDEVLAHVFFALLKQDAALSFPDITYGFYPVYCRIFDIDHNRVPLRPDFTIDRAALAAAAGPLIFPNPNAPTGLAIARDEIATLLHARPDRLVVVDEAYVDFGAESVVPLIADFPNLLVIQTLSKSRGLAGLRVGFALGDATLIEALRRVRDSLNSYPVGRIAEAGAIAALRDEAYFRATVDKVVRSREILTDRLAALGFETLPSHANFIFTRHAARGGAELARALQARDILVRHFPGLRTGDFVRISVGSPAEIERLCAEIEDILTEAPAGLPDS